MYRRVCDFRHVIRHLINCRIITNRCCLGLTMLCKVRSSPYSPAFGTDRYDIRNKAFVDIRLHPGVARPLAPYGPLRPNVTSFINRKYITYRNAAAGGQNHGHMGSAQKIREDRCSGSRDMLADRQTHTHRQTDKLIAIHCTPLPYRGGVKNGNGIICL